MPKRNAQITVYDTSVSALADLQNAYNVFYSLRMNELWRAQFTLPASDAKNTHCARWNYFDLYDGDRYVGMFRIVNTEHSGVGRQAEVRYTGWHVLSTLLDDIWWGYQDQGGSGNNTETVLTNILAEQGTARWQLGTVDFAYTHAYAFESMKLLGCLLAVPGPLSEEWHFTFDTESYPWTLNLVEASTDVVAHVRYAKNMRHISYVEQGGEVANRIYALGRGDGVNQLDITGETPGGEAYVEDTDEQPPIIEDLLIASEVDDAATLYAAAQAALEDRKTPRKVYTIRTADLTPILGRDHISPGDYIRVEHTDLSIAIGQRVISVQKSRMKAKPHEMVIEISNKAATVGSAMAGLAKRVQTMESFALGAVCLYTVNDTDNCDPDYPFELAFRVDDDLTHLNKVLLSYTTDAYRSFTRITAGGDATSGNNSQAGDPHTHSIPEHGHDSAAGITEAVSSPASVVLLVDGNTVAGAGTSETDLDILANLDGYSGGEVTRGWHTISINPDVAGRVTCSVFVKGFGMSRGGSQY